MSESKTTHITAEAGSTPARTHLDDLPDAMVELSQEDVELVSGGIGIPRGKVPLDDDATYVPGVPNHLD